MIRRPPRSTLSSSSAASDVYKRQRHTPWPASYSDAASEARDYPSKAVSTESGSELQPLAGMAVRVRRDASGLQANRTGAYGEVPSPAETSSQAAPAGACDDGVAPAPGHHRETPFARRRSRSQLVTSVP